MAESEELLTFNVKEEKAYQYCKWAIPAKNKKVPRYVKKQASLWKKIADGKDKEACIDETAYQKICTILKSLNHPDLGCTIYEGLDPYAWLFITAILCTKLKKETKVRYYVTGILEIARKNFKTFISAIIFIILMLTDPKFSRFFSVAPDLKLSKELQLAMRKIIKSSDELIDDDDPAFKLLRSEIRCLYTESEYTPLAYSEDRMDGKLANAFLADEAGAMDNYPIEAMRSSQITLLSKLGIIISTQYPNDDNGMIDEIDLAKKTLDGLIDDKRTFALLYEPDQEYQSGDHWQSNDDIIYQANPVAVTYKYIFDELKKRRGLAILFDNKKENFLCKHLNIKYKGLGVEGYIDITKVRNCVWNDDKEFWQGKRVWLALDLSLSDDNTSVVMVTESDGIIYDKAFGFIPKDKIDAKSKKERVDYQKLIINGECFACGDEVIDYSFVEDFIKGNPDRPDRKMPGLEKEYGVEIVQIGYDKWNAISSVQKLEAAGYECVEIKQHSSVLHPPTKFLREEILKKTFRYAKNQMLEINFQNARCTEDTNKNKYVNKKKSAGKVDMVIGTIMAVYLLQQELLHGTYDFVIQT